MTQTTGNWNVNVLLQKKCPTICGSRKAAREGQEEQEVLGTAITCSAIGRSKSRKASITAASPTRRLRNCAARRTPYPRPHWSSTCSTWPPWSLPCSVREASCCSCLPTHSPLNFGGNAAEEWWKVSARTMRTVCRSCFSHERRRRSRRLLAAPPTRSTLDMSTA